ncbi:MAG: SRPBCC family protein [Chloroflexi bacterium]|nr:SRPBCC family protein [Chloroflexota bacterium]
MQRISRSIRVAAQPDRCFDYVVDPSHALDWMHNMTRFEPEASGPARVGSRVHASAVMLGIPLSTVVQVVDVDPPRRFVSETSGRLRSRATWEFAPVDFATDVTFIGDYEIPGIILRLVGAQTVLGELQFAAEQSLANLKRRIEGP